ncbi:F-box protein: endocytic membrane traffic, recycling ReCYcling 1 [Coemansia helicoidea]|uniref:F-box protein: endocytic membrane traffic, recycling ReCYcling 1 n=1 Tax=Coemansia helicoidea TaxID=1286919 RepID=A0ACC1LD69_9FUNG|nr:F-box protein: endocytic membrane traffic, recycling ReCYcling 1 [Coemansia helicoidea]
MSPEGLLPPAELASMYTRQFAGPKSLATSIYHSALLASTETAGHTYTHGMTVLQCARGRGPIDPHVYRDWLVFEERLKQSHRRLRRKKRSYLLQVLAFGILVLYFAWFGFFGTRSYRSTCKLLSAGSAYCTYLIITNRRFLQSIKYPVQCNRALHQFRLRFETTPLQTATPFLAASVDGAPDGAPRLAVESQLSFFPTVPRQLRDGYLEFKATYYRKRDAAKKRIQDRLRQSKRHKDTASSPNYRTSERRSRQRAPHFAPTHGPDSDGGTSAISAAALLAGIDSATDDSSTTTSSVVPRRTASRRAPGRPGSSLIHPLPEHGSGSESDVRRRATLPGT